MARLALLLLLGAIFIISPGFSQDTPPASLPSTAQGNGTPSHEDPVVPVLLALTVILAGAKLGGELFERIHQPSVLGELVFGVILGNIVLVNPSWNFFDPLRAGELTAQWAVVIDGLSRIGVILLLFEVGLESTLGEMRKVGVSSFLVATAGVIAPFFLGYFVSWMFVKEVPAAVLRAAPQFDINNIHLFVGATLSATSVGITARVFKDLGRMHLPETKIVLGAAVIDDVLGLLILAVVGGIVVAGETGTPLSVAALFKVTGMAVGFLLGAIILGLVAAPRLMSWMARLHSRGTMIISSVLFCFALAYLAGLAGLAAIVGAFAAGLILEEVHFSEFREKKPLMEVLSPVTAILVPVFFVLMGLRVRLETFFDMNVLGLAAGLTLAAFVGKQVCGLAAVGKKLDRLTIGLGMVPRGEVGLIFAGIGRSLGIIDDALFSAVVIMVILTTFVTPPLLKFSVARYQHKNISGHS